MTKTILLAAWMATTFLWILSATRWKRRTLERPPAGSAAWFWLRVLGIPETDTNRTKMITWASIGGITLMTVTTFAIVLFGRECRAELHWYEAHGIGRKEVKRKRYLD